VQVLSRDRHFVLAPVPLKDRKKRCSSNFFDLKAEMSSHFSGFSPLLNGAAFFSIQIRFYRKRLFKNTGVIQNTPDFFTVAHVFF
jgi:hypothetical protein